MGGRAHGAADSTLTEGTTTPADLERMKVKAQGRFVSALNQAIDNVVAISGMTVPEVREVAAGRGGTLKAIKIDASPTALAANLAIIDRAMGKVADKAEDRRITVPIQINMGSGRVMDVQPPVTVTMTPPSQES